MMPTNDRPDASTASLVDTALVLQAEFSTRAAAWFLTSKGADFRLTVRVLSEPAQRRQLTLAKLP